MANDEHAVVPIEVELDAEAGLGDDFPLQERPPKPVSFRQMFRYATRYDYVLLLIGTIGSVGFGLALPITVLFVGELLDAVGATRVNNAADTSLNFVYIGCATIV